MRRQRHHTHDVCVLLFVVVLTHNFVGGLLHPFCSDRTHEAVKLTAVPTLLRWGKTNPTARLVEGQCANADMLADLLEAE